MTLSEAPPPVRRDEVIDLYHGIQVVDPYRWLESKSVERDECFAAQNDYARRVLRSLPGREFLRGELRDANRDVERVQVLKVIGEGPRVIALRRGAQDETSKLVVRDGWDGKDRVLVDPNERGRGDARATIDAAFPSHDGRYVAYVISMAGSEEGTIEIVEVQSARILPDRIDRMPQKISWRSDGRSFFYWRRARPLPGSVPADWLKDSATYLHTIGTDPNVARPVIAAGTQELGLRRHDLPWIEATIGSRWALAGATTGTSDPAYFVAPVATVKPGTTAWRRVATMEDKVQRMLVHGDQLYALTYANAPNFRIVSFNARSGTLAKATSFVTGSDLVLVDFAAARDAMYVVALDRGIHRLFQVSWRTATRREVALPFKGSVRRMLADPTRAGLVFNMEGWTQRPAWFRFDGSTRVHDLPITSPSTGIEGFLAEQTTVLSPDGSEVPLSIIRRSDKALDGSAPGLLYGYGAYGITNTPAYNPSVLTWVKLGGIYATCHVRGGGERGKAWHLAGIKEKKENGVDDFISCAEYLIQKGYTKSSRLTAFGASAGGIVVGGAITKRPELFRAAAMRVGQLNLLRTEVTEGGSVNMEEYGDVKVEKEFRSLLASDPYHRIREGVDYPAVLLTTGLNDRRLPAWVPAKFAARLQATGRRGPFLLRLQSDDGHGFGATQTQQEEEYADIYAFALWRSGVLVKQAP